MKSDLKRMWINNPSNLQKHHIQHGTKVLADFSENLHSNAVTVYFLEGNIISARIQKQNLSKGWK